MSLFIEVYVGSKKDRILVADCHAYNISDLADVSDYEFTSRSDAAWHLDIPPSYTKSFIKGHDRKKNVWALVEKIARKSK